jgi:hypothetical protein
VDFSTGRPGPGAPAAACSSARTRGRGGCGAIAACRWRVWYGAASSTTVATAALGSGPVEPASRELEYTRPS